MTLKVLLVDDERRARDKLKKLLTVWGQPYEAKEAASGMEAIEVIQEFDPDLVFLDIDMPKMSGFDLLCHLEERSFAVVFQTAYDEFALKAFEENAVDYLLKPISQERFNRSMEKVMNQGRKKPDDVATTLAQAGMHLEKITVKVGQKYKVYTVDNILYFKSENRIVKLFTDQEDMACDLSLSNLEGKLDQQQFTRVHRACLVNANKVQEFINQKNRSFLKMVNGDEVEVSRDRRPMVKKMFAN